MSKTSDYIILLFFVFVSSLIFFSSGKDDNTHKIEKNVIKEQLPVPSIIQLKNASVTSTIDKLNAVKDDPKNNDILIDITVAKKSKLQINEEIEQKYKLPNGLLSALHQKETSGRCDVTSRVGASGCFQLMPKTERYIENKFNIDVEPTDYRSSAKASAIYLTYLKKKIEKYYPILNDEVQWGLALASYNAGPKRGLMWANKVSKHNIKTVTEATKYITYKESRNYMKDIGEKVFGEKYTVKSGDTLYGISKKVNVSIDNLIAEVGTNQIKPGQVIRIN